MSRCDQEECELGQLSGVTCAAQVSKHKYEMGSRRDRVTLGQYRGQLIGKNRSIRWRKEIYDLSIFHFIELLRQQDE